jgi:hypothetical protein
VDALERIKQWAAWKNSWPCCSDNKAVATARGGFYKATSNIWMGPLTPQEETFYVSCSKFMESKARKEELERALVAAEKQVNQIEKSLARCS